MDRRSVYLGGFALLLLLSACTNDSPNEPAPIPNDEPTEAPVDPDGDDDEAPADEEIDVSTVPSNPEDIDIEYVQAVMDEIDPIIQASAAVLAAVQDINDANVRELYMAAYEEEAAQRQLEEYLMGDGPSELREDPDPIETVVLEVLLVTTDCVLFTAERDYLPLFEDSDAFTPVQPYYLRLESDTPSEVNPTAWRLSLDTFFGDESDIPPVEAACA